MSITQRGSSTTDFGFGTSITCTKPTGLQVGDLLLWNVVNGPNGQDCTITTPSGWTKIDETKGSNGTPGNGTTTRVVLQALLVKIADASDVAASSFTCTGTVSGTSGGTPGVQMAAILTAWTGVDTSGTAAAAVEAYSKNSNGTTTGGTTITATGITVASTGGMLLGNHGEWETDRGPLTGMSVLTGSGNQGISIDSLANPSTGATGNLTCSCSSTEVWTVILLSLKAATAATQNPGSEPRIVREPQPDELLTRRLAVPLAIVALSGFPAPPRYLNRSINDPPPLEDLRSARRRFVLPSGAAPAYVPTQLRRSIIDTPAEDLRSALRWRFPESVDDPVFLLWSGMEELPPPEPVQRARRLDLGGGVAASSWQALTRESLIADRPLEDLVSRRPLRLPESVDQPPVARLRQPADTPQADRPIALLWRWPESVDAAPLERQPQARETPAEDVVSRLRWRFPESVDRPPPPRAAQARDTAQEDLRAHLLWRFPESVDQPLLSRWEPVGQTPLEDVRIRVLPRLPDPPVMPVDQPPAPRWKTINDTPQTDLVSARGRFVLPSGVAPAYQPLFRWPTAREPSWDEPRLALRLRLPESVDQPPLLLRRGLPETLPEERLPALPRRLPESVDLPPFGLRKLLEQPLLELRVQTARPLLVLTAVVVDAPPLVRLRIISDTPFADRPIALRVRVADPPPMPVNDPPPQRRLTIKDTPLEDLWRPRRFVAVLPSGQPRQSLERLVETYVLGDVEARSEVL